MRDLHESTVIFSRSRSICAPPLHHPTDQWVHPEEFIELSAEAEAMGFAGVMAGPLVRSSYRARDCCGQRNARPRLRDPAIWHHVKSGSTLQEAGSVLDRLKKRQELHRSMAAARSAMTGQGNERRKNTNLSPLMHYLLPRSPSERPSLIDAYSGRTLSVERGANPRRLAWYFHFPRDWGRSRIVVCANSIWHFIVHTTASWIRAVTVPSRLCFRTTNGRNLRGVSPH